MSKQFIEGDVVRPISSFFVGVNQDRYVSKFHEYTVVQSDGTTIRLNQPTDEWLSADKFEYVRGAPVPVEVAVTDAVTGEVLPATIEEDEPTVTLTASEVRALMGSIYFDELEEGVREKVRFAQTPEDLGYMDTFSSVANGGYFKVYGEDALFIKLSERAALRLEKLVDIDGWMAIVWLADAFYGAKVADLYDGPNFGIMFDYDPADDL